MAQAPNYRPVEIGNLSKCSTCAFANGSLCTLYNFTFQENHICDSWEGQARFSGIVLMFKVPPIIADKLVTRQGNYMAADDMHLTLSYFGKVGKVGFELADLLRATQDFIRQNPITINGYFTDTFRFEGAEEEGEDVVVLLYESPELLDYQNRLVAYLAENGIQTKNEGFIPHVTITRVPHNVAVEIDYPTEPFSFGEVWLGWGDRRIPVNTTNGVTRMSKFTDFVSELKKFIDGFSKEEDEPEEERALNYEQIWSQLWEKAERWFDETQMAWYPLDVVLEGERSYALLAMNAKLYLSELSVDGDEMTFGEPYRVTTSYIPVTTEERATATIYRQKDGRIRVTVIAATAVLNRVRAIDSKALFDSFASHVERTGEYPIINFAHQGGGSRLGEADYIARDENVYIVSYLFDDNEYGEAAARTVSENPEEWGHSIEFYPTQPPEIIEASGMKVPVYTDGINRRISILKENKAAHWFTNVKEIERMNDKIFNDLEELMGGNKELATKFAEQVDGVNREVVEEDLIVRGDDSASSSTDDGAVGGRTPEGDEDEALNAFRAIVREEMQTVMANVTFTPDEGFVADIVKQVEEGQTFTALNEAVTELRQTVQANQEAHDITRRSVTQLNSRLNAVEQPVNEMVEQRQASMPYQGGFNVTVTRPSEVRRSANADNIEVPPNSEDLVQNGLGKLPNYRVPGGN